MCVLPYERLGGINDVMLITNTVLDFKEPHKGGFVHYGVCCITLGRNTTYAADVTLTSRGLLSQAEPHSTSFTVGPSGEDMFIVNYSKKIRYTENMG